MSKQFNEFQLSKALRIRIGDDGNMYGMTTHSSGEFYLAPEIVSILCQVGKLESKFNMNNIHKNLNLHYKNILKNLPDEKECEVILNDLIASGLIISNKKEISREALNDGFGDHWIQWAMLADTSRCAAYEKALLKAINSKSIVADVGAGTGFLTAVCLKAGAKKVFAIEETQIAQKIIPFLKNLKLPTQKESLTIVNKNSFDSPLPHNVTHVVSELFGNDPLQEGVIPTLRNLSQSFPNQPLYIPEKVSVYFELIDILDHPIKHRIQALFTKQKTNFISDCLTSAKNIFNLDGLSFPIALSKNQFKRIASPIELGQLPLNPPLSYTNKKQHPLFGHKKITCQNEGNCVVGLLWFRDHLNKNETLSTHCIEKDAADHWSPLVILLNQPIAKKEEITVQYGLNDLETNINCKIFINKGKNLIGERE